MKTWFMHDMNCSQKDGFSMLLEQKNGTDLYGKFWLLQEHFYGSQIHKTFSEKIRINESTLKKVLRTNQKRLPNLLETFQECLGIVSERFQERFGNVYELTMPNSLNYITTRVQKSSYKIKKDIKKERESKSALPILKIEEPTLPI